VISEGVVSPRVVCTGPARILQRGLVALNLTRPYSIVSESDTVLKLENKVIALEGRLREFEKFENTCSAQNEKIANLQGGLAEVNKSIKVLENRNNRIKVALAVLGILFTSSMIIVFYTHQSYDLFTSYYTTGKIGLNALLANPLFHKL